ncbi:MAG: helix-turn-helix domain-containing protein [Bacillota bacterium]
MDTIGKRIHFLRKKHNLTQKQLADSTGLQRGNLSHYEKDKIKPAADAIIALSRFFNVSTDWLLTGKEKSREAYLPGNLSEEERAELERYGEFIMWRRGKAKQPDLYIAENMNMFEQEEEVLLPLLRDAAVDMAEHKLFEGFVPVPKKIAGENTFLFRVRDSSMREAGIEYGDLVIVRFQPHVENGETALVRVGDDFLVTCMSEKQPHEEMRIVGKVVGSVKKEDADVKICRFFQE